MKRALVSIGLVTALAALAPTPGETAGPTRGTPSHGHSGSSYRAYPYPYPYYYRPNYYRPYYYRPYYYSSLYVAPLPYVAAPGYYYYSAPPGYAGPQGYTSLAPAPQIQREVIFPEGRYVLQGDGESDPFRWVWVPNPPTAPPAASQDPG